MRLGAAAAMFSLCLVVLMPSPVKQDVGLEIYYSGGWHDVAAADEVFADTVSVTRGQSSEGAAFRPCMVTGQLNNATDRYRTSNPESQLYGLAGRNTPVRVKVDGSVRGVAEASSWRCDQTNDFRASPRRGRAWTDLQAGGLLQRIGQWSEPVRSPFYLYNTTEVPSSVGYWPMEDPSGARRLYTPTPGARSSALRGVEFGSQTRFAGSEPMLVLPDNPSTFAGGNFAPGSPTATDGWQLSFAVNFGSIGGAGDVYSFLSWGMTDGSAYSLTWLDGTDLLLLADTRNGTSMINTSFDISPQNTAWNRWNVFVLQATYSGGTTTLNLYYMTEGSNVFAGAYTASFSGVPSSLDGWQMRSGAAFNDVSVGHLIGTRGVADDFLSGYRYLAWIGHDGETAADRFARLCSLRNVPYTILGTAAASQKMGPQQADRFEDLLKEIVTTDDALLYDDIDSIGIVLNLLNHRLNQDPALTLSPTDFRTLPKEITDDLGTHNVVTASQREGGDVTVTDSTTSMGAQDPPSGVGEYQFTVDVNLADPEVDLEPVARWELNKGTVELPRYPTVTIDLAASPGLVADAEAVDVGSVIEIVAWREYTIRLFVAGIREVIGTHTRTITFTCFPDRQYVVGVYDAAGNRYDLRSCTLNGPHSSSAASLALSIAEDEAWSTTDTPYDLIIAGEQITVNTMAARTGSGPYSQVATSVTRSVNGIVKALPGGAPVHIATPGRYAR